MAINTYRETSLHHDLKLWYAQPGDQLECHVDGYVIDLVRDGLLVEFQTANFSALRKKLSKLLENHSVRLVYPTAQNRHIVRIDAQSGRELSRRKSPKGGVTADVFSELVYIYPWLQNSRFSIEVLLIHDEEIRINDGKGSWRRKGWSIMDRRLVQVVERHVFENIRSLLLLLPNDLPTHFTTADLASSMKCRRRLAQQAAYCLREMGLLQITGKQGNALVYSVGSETADS